MSAPPGYVECERCGEFVLMWKEGEIKYGPAWYEMVPHNSKCKGAITANAMRRIVREIIREELDANRYGGSIRAGEQI